MDFSHVPAAIKALRVFFIRKLLNQARSRAEEANIRMDHLLYYS